MNFALPNNDFRISRSSTVSASESFQRFGAPLAFSAYFETRNESFIMTSAISAPSAESARKRCEAKSHGVRQRMTRNMNHCSDIRYYRSSLYAWTCCAPRDAADAELQYRAELKFSGPRFFSLVSGPQLRVVLTI